MEKVLALLAKVRPYAKAAVAVAGFVVVVAEQVASGHFNAHALEVSGTVALTAIGVYGTRNVKPAPVAPVPVAPTPPAVS